MLLLRPGPIPSTGVLRELQSPVELLGADMSGRRSCSGTDLHRRHADLPSFAAALYWLCAVRSGCASADGIRGCAARDVRGWYSPAHAFSHQRAGPDARLLPLLLESGANQLNEDADGYRYQGQSC